MNTFEQSAMPPSTQTLPQIPEGECQCGCGGLTTVSKYNHKRDGHVKGKPLKYINGHNRRFACKRPESRNVEIEGVVYSTLPLTRGKVAIIDACEFDRASALVWRMREGYKTDYAVSGGGNSASAPPIVHLHRFIMRAPDGVMVDHKNHNGLDNRRCNLRIATDLQNKMNRKKHKIGTSKFLGVSLTGDGKWVAQIKFQGKNHNLGRFNSETEAALAYDESARKCFGEFANPNFG